MARRFTPMADRFWAKVAIAGEDECWLWQAYTNPAGYGNIGTGGKRGRIVLAHRYSYELNVGPIPEGMGVLHSCDTPACVNPRHLWPGTAADNTRDMLEKDRAKKTTVNKGSRHYLTSLTEDDVRRIRALYTTGRYRQEDIGKMFGVAKGTVTDICSRKSWKHVKPRILRRI